MKEKRIPNSKWREMLESMRRIEKPAGIKIIKVEETDQKEPKQVTV